LHLDWAKQVERRIGRDSVDRRPGVPYGAGCQDAPVLHAVRCRF